MRVQNVTDCTLYTGDSLDVLANLADESVQCVVTSPPYFMLRSYLPPSSPDKALEVGSEGDAADYVDHLVRVFREVRRVLRNDGTLWLNLGDCYAGSGAGGGGNRKGNEHGQHDRMRGTGRGRVPEGVKAKDLMGIPWRVAFALRDDGWWLRSDIIWQKPNAMPNSLRDRPVSSHEYLFLLSKSPRYYYDHEAVKERAITQECRAGRQGAYARRAMGQGGDGTTPSGENADPVRRNLRSVWSIPTKPFKESHFACFPPALVEPCVRAGTSERGMCSACGTPWKRLTQSTPMTRKKGLKSGGYGSPTTDALGGGMIDPPRSETIGWAAGCACDAPVVPCAVLDPFSGAATTGLVACSMGRRYIGIDLNPEYVDMAQRRLLNANILAAKEDFLDVEFE